MEWITINLFVAFCASCMGLRGRVATISDIVAKGDSTVVQSQAVPTPTKTARPTQILLPGEEDSRIWQAQNIGKYTRDLKQTPNDPNLYLWRGQSYQLLMQYDQAIDDFTQAIKADAHFAPAYSARAGAYCELKQYEKAIVDCTALIELEPNEYHPYLCRAWTYYQLMQYDEAIKDFTEAIQRHPADQRKWAATYEMRAKTYDALRDYFHELADYSKAIQLYPDSGAFYKGRGLAYAAVCQYESAVTDLTEAIAHDRFVDPSDEYYQRGLCYAALGNYDKAILDYTEVIRYWSPVADFLKEDAARAHPVYVEAYERRAKAYEATGNKKEADADFEKAKQLGLR
jgi:tetratricopeptide (TPR) repeat protein